ncbi:WhiB family transcriptional regulator [Streptomyces sp. G45]|uniref:WhiB family transcriptional regulator n=1 Tax=Streptomyces sp. G45 TaxID=3406627 RepID=UPI003C1ABEE4
MHFDTTMTEPELAWQEQALCAQTGPDFFFPEPGSSVREAKRICRLCEMRSACLTYALDNDERFGVWGGLSEKERQNLRREQATRRA